ncbi:MAG: CotH kinase family protein [Prolixibacteraceae bacterium]|nr:CotH kinase family protein [Prolixibacteraceae bacterium]
MMHGQIVVNEVLSSNASGITDEDGDFTDWIELYNASEASINLEGYSINDDLVDTLGWVFPAIDMAPGSHLLLYASGKDRRTFGLHLRTVIQQGDVWQYAIPPLNNSTGNWRIPGYQAEGWETGPSGFGYGDNDDQTVISSLNSIFIRKTFDIDHPGSLEELTLHVDFDDAFIAFINGIPVAMENVHLPDPANYDVVEVTGQHEAMMYQGGVPNEYVIDLSKLTLFEGENVLALQGYNTSTTSSDFSLIPFLTIGSTQYAYSDVASFVKIHEGGLHTHFKVNNDGEGLFLRDAQQQMIDSVWVPALPADYSWGRTTDGDPSWAYFIEPTPGVQNSNPSDELRNDSIQFLPAAGFYSGAVHVSLLTSAPDVTIRYTTDGTEPVANSEAYTGPLTLTKTTVVRAASYYAGRKISDIFTQSYLFDADHQLPVFSITTDPLNLWDYNEGIYVLGPGAESANPNWGANFWMDWEKPVHLEFFDEQKVQQLNQGAGIKITGAWSRANAQKSIALFARSQYGKGSFKYKLFKDRNFDKFESFVLRNSGNDWSYSMLRDGFVSEIARSIDVDRLAFQPSVVYLNGEYWGIMNLREKPSEHYFASHYSIDEIKLNLLEMNSQTVHGTNADYAALISFLNKNTLVKEENYRQVKELVDVECFIDYELIQIYINNTDWPGNNIKYWNSSDSHTRWRWLLYDTDFGLDIWGGGAYRENGIAFATDPNNSNWPNPSWSTLVLRKMLLSPEFKYQFVNRMADLMNTLFSTDAMNAKLDSLSELMRPEIADHRQRWGHNSNWDSFLNVIYNFNNVRPRYVRDHFAEYFDVNYLTLMLSVSDQAAGLIKVNTIVPETYPFKGTYFTNIPVTFTALPNVGYKFVRWEKSSGSTDPSITLTMKGPTSLHAVFEPVRGDEIIDLVINELKYSDTEDFDSGDWIELYNNGSQTIDLSGYVLSDANISNSFIFPPGMMLYPNSYMVICENKDKFNRVYPKVTNSIGDLTFGLSSAGDIVFLYDPDFNIIDQVLYETKQPWPVEPLESAATLELKNPELDNNLSASWQAGQSGGTPGMRNGIYTSAETIALQPGRSTCFPTRFSDYTTLVVPGNGSRGCDIRIYDMQGRVRYQLKGDFKGENQLNFDLFTDQQLYQSGVYLIQIDTDLTSETIKVIKH